jgi:outer membrane protein OmpA-like peptidoglycan-associated protein
MKTIYNFKTHFVRLICFFSLLFFSISGWSQAESKTFNDRFAIGGGFGLNFPSLRYSDPNLAVYQSSVFGRGSVGLFFEYDLTDNISIRPELFFLGRGQLIDDQGVYYRFAPSYVDWRLPVLLNLGKKGGVQPYLMFAPILAFASGGSIEDEVFEVGITQASIYPVDLLLRLGAGIKIPLKSDKFTVLTGLQVAYDLGLVDSYSADEFNGTANALNKAYYSINGTRKNKGLEITASLAIPFSNFKSDRPKNVPAKSLFAQEKEPIQEKEVEKECYTIEEINALIDMGKNVNNKVICMNNLNFDFNKSTLDKSSRGYLDHVVTLLNKVSKMNMKISGHTDNVGKDDFNLDLSKKRASAVYDYLVSKGVDKNRLSFEFFGASKPLVPNDSDENRAKNRRVEFEIIQK